MKVVVPDASVILEWVLPDYSEDGWQQALKVREAAINADCVLKVPSLWLYEVSNTLSRRFPKQAKDLIQSLQLFGLEESKWNEDWLDKALFLTKRYQVTFYDAAYHSLALHEKGMFVTADQQYVLKTKSAGSVVLLSNWVKV